MRQCGRGGKAPGAGGARVALLADMAAMVLVVLLLTLFLLTLVVSTATVVRDLTAQARGRTLHPQRNAAEHPLEGA